MSKNILILTHTHAGIASIKQKMSKEHIPLKNVCISTITGFAQHIAILFYGKNILEKQEDKKYFNDIQEKVLRIISLNGVLNIIKRTYLIISAIWYRPQRCFGTADSRCRIFHSGGVVPLKLWFFDIVAQQRV